MNSGAESRLLDVLPGFDHVNRYWDETHQFNAAKILPGEYYVTQHDEGIVTVLGSCISACIRDRVSGIGGMNHFMLPSSKNATKFDKPGGLCITAATRYGSYAMEHMINDILKYGGRRESLEIKITGGGKILQNMSDVGEQNIRFVTDYLKTEKLKILSLDVGEIYPRKVQYFPASGQLRIKKLRAMHNDTIIKREQSYQHEIEDHPVTGEVELF